jgi:hypothetical protein
MGTKWAISTEGGTEPLWAPDGRELFYRNGDELMVVSITLEPSFNPGIPTLLFEGSFVGTRRTRSQVAFAGPSTNYDITADGQRFVMIQPDEESVPSQITVVLNWFEELKRLVPVNR